MIREVKDGRLSSKLYRYIHDIHKAVKEMRDGTRKDDVYDYPAMVVGCQYNSHDACGRSLSVPKHIAMKIQRGELHTAVVSSLRRVKPGEKIPGHYVDSHTQRVRFLGTCAEDEAASRVLRGLGVAGGFRLANLGFTKAIRPRTGSKKSYCETCKQIFG